MKGSFPCCLFKSIRSSLQYSTKSYTLVKVIMNLYYNDLYPGSLIVCRVVTYVSFTNASQRIRPELVTRSDCERVALYTTIVSRVCTNDIFMMKFSTAK